MMGENLGDDLINIVDLDAAPVVPVGWSVVKHIKGGHFSLDSTRVRLYVCQISRGMRNDDMYREIEEENPFNANLLDYLLVHRWLIPKKWKGKSIHFRGTIYRDLDGEQCVRYLYCCEDEWHEGYNYLEGDWGISVSCGSTVSK
ncbi:MAG: hypothetical protein HZA35_01570 [Parcubacteria group bacterium]|nr:hypothetical protein [Parcubacteria group bacterium]